MLLVQKKKMKSGHQYYLIKVPDFPEFDKYIQSIKKFVAACNDVAESFYRNTDSNSVILPNNVDAQIDFLETVYDDKSHWVSYFVYELDFGKKYEEGCVTRNGKAVPFETTENLYNVLIENLKEQ